MTDKLNKTTYSPDDIVLVTGRIDMPETYFRKFYAPYLDAAIKAGVPIRVGSASGCDTLTREHCASKNYENLRVFVPSKKREKETPSGGKYTVTYVNGGYEARDDEMCKGCTCVITSLSQYGAAGSGAFANTLKICAGIENSYDVIYLARKASCPWDADTRERVIETENALAHKSADE